LVPWWRGSTGVLRWPTARGVDVQKWWGGGSLTCATTHGVRTGG
jgi:hypothetical protein